LALSEFVAMETAYQALRPLDAGARQRALSWLTDALGVTGTLPQAATSASPAPATQAAAVTAPVTAAPAAVAAPTGRDRSRRSAGTGSGRRGKKATAGERAYRRMPDAADVRAAYREVGSVSALADHYGVPRHTVQGWARRLRREGYDIGRSA
jgi:hypothetical protein